MKAWATVEPYDRSSESIARMLAVLDSIPLPEELEPLRMIALEDEPEDAEVAGRAALFLARHYPVRREEIEFRHHIVGAWLWLSAWHECAAGTLLLVDALFMESQRRERCVADGTTDVQSAETIRMNAYQWFMREIHSDLTGDDPTLIIKKLDDGLRWKPTATIREGPHRVIVEPGELEIIDPELKSYKVLTDPLRLVGGNLDPEAVIQILQREFPWMTSAIERVADDLALCFLNPEPWARIRPLLLVGPPGSGKSRFARRLAELLGMGFRIIGAAGSSDDRDLQGTAHGWGNREPGAVLRLIATSGVANPVIVVDEIDKAGGSDRNGDVRRTLLGMIEHETSKRWFDECLQAHADISGVSWIMTANDVAPISKPLLSRLSVVEVGPPGPRAVDAILDGMRADLAVEIGIDPDRLPLLGADARCALADALVAGHSLRRIKTALARALAATARHMQRRS